ncbi:MAG TPA: rod shape-determining protein MreC [Gaiellaceae bacterium]|nr:rod shape-determining protein MreC [Gaiellaceae bacterium]
MPRQRTARLPVLDASARRTEGPSPRTSRALRARLVAAVLVLFSLALITVYFRESEEGTLHSAQRIGLSVAMPFEVAGERIARPFRDAWGWTSDLVGAKQENEKLRKQVEALRQRVIQEQTAVSENDRLRDLLSFVDGPSFPAGFTGVSTRVVGRPPSAYNQEVLIAAGSSAGVRRNDPVVTQDGLVGLVTNVTSNGAKVTLLTDQSSAVSAIVLESGAAGVVRHGPSDSSALVLDRVGKDEFVEEGNLVITAGWRSGKLESLYPRGIPVGMVKSVGQQDVDLYKRIQVAPLVNFDALAEVIVLVPKKR